MKATIVIVILLTVFSALPAQAADRKETLVSTQWELLKQEYSQGKLDYSEYLFLSLQAGRNSRGLPGRITQGGSLSLRCGTLPGLEVLRNWSELDETTQGLLAAPLARPSTSLTYNSPGGHFKIHYDTVGANAVPTDDTNSNSIPDYIERTAQYADSSWHTEVEIMGYLPPPSDGIEGGDSRYDIYVLDLGTGLYGYAQPENPGPAPGNDYSSFLAVHKNMVIGFTCPNTDPDGVQLGRLKATVAHEFFHAVQFAYDVFDSDWFYETSSTWMEDVVFDQSNDYYCYLPGHFIFPEVSLQLANGSSEYSHCIWNHYLAANFGDSVVKKIWEGIISGTALASMQNVLANNYGTTLSAQFQEFTVWNYITGFRDDGAHYQEGATWDTAWIMREENTFPFYNHAASTSPFDERPDNLGSNYIRLNVPSLSGKLFMSFDGQDGNQWGASVVKQVSPGVYDFDQITLNGNGAGEVEIPVVDGYSEVILIPALLSTSGNNRTYLYSAYQCLAVPGDANNNGSHSLADVISGANYVFSRPGCSPVPLCWLSNLLCRGDWNGDGQVALLDVIRGANFVLSRPGGPWDPPASGACCQPVP